MRGAVAEVSIEPHLAEEADAALLDGGRLGDPEVVVPGEAPGEVKERAIGGIGVGIVVVVGGGRGAGAGSVGGREQAVERVVEALLVVFLFFPGFAHRFRFTLPDPSSTGAGPRRANHKSPSLVHTSACGKRDCDWGVDDCVGKRRDRTILEEEGFRRVGELRSDDG